MPAITARTGPRKVRLNKARIVQAGLAVASENHSSTFSAKDLGEELGVDPTAIYRHFRNKGHLMEALLDELHARSVRSITAPPEDWRGQIRQLAAATLDEFSSHPSVAGEAMVVTTHGPGELAAVELFLSALTRSGLDGDDVVQHYALISSYVLSTASGIARSRAESFDDPDVDVAATDADMPWLDGPILADPRTHPHIAKFTVELAELKDREIYMLGIETLLNAAERAAAATTR